MLKDRIIATIDFFYPPFRKFMPLQTFRYVVCGGGNTLLDYLLWAFGNYIIFKQQIVYTPLGAINSYIAAFLMAFAVSFPLGFYLNRNIVFTGSSLRGRVQLVRYGILVAICLGMNYIFLKLFIEQMHLHDYVARALTMLIVISFSYVTQKYFTFKVVADKQ